MIDIVTIGELTLDDVVLTSGETKMGVIGGGALYSAMGALIWNKNVGINSMTGKVYYEKIISSIQSLGIKTEGISFVPGHGIELWLLHESDTEKQQVPKLSSKKYSELDNKRPGLNPMYSTARGFHLAPQSVGGHKKAIKEINKKVSNPIISLDLQADKFIDITEYKKNFFTDGITAFLPSKEEVEIIWGAKDLKKWIIEMINKGVSYVAVKRGGEGSVVIDEKKDAYSIPIYPTSDLDTTGAGDAYCGGFIAGLVEGKSIIDAAIMGTVSASLIVEKFGALSVTIPSKKLLNKRFMHVKKRISYF